MAEVFDFGLQQHKIKMDGKFFENDLFAVAGDTGRRLEVQLLDSNNMVQNTTGISLRLNANVAGQATYAEATLIDATKGLYELDLPNGMLLAPGNWQFQWQIIGVNGEKLHSFAFMGSIGSNLSEGGTEATNFYLNIEDIKETAARIRSELDKVRNGFVNSGTNLANTSNARDGYYITTNGGFLQYVADSNFITYLIPANPSSSYFATLSDYYYYYFDLNYATLGFSGNPNGGDKNVVLLTPLNTGFFAVSVKKDNAGLSNLVIAKGNTLPTEIKPTLLSEGIKVDESSVIKKGIQLFDKTKVVENQYAFTYRMPVSFGQTFDTNIAYKTGGDGIVPFAYRNKAGVVIQQTAYGTGVTVPSITKVPFGAVDLQVNMFKSAPGFTFTKADLDKTMIFEGTVMSDHYVPYGQSMFEYIYTPAFTNLISTRIDNNIPKIITVKADGTKDFTKLSEARKAVDPSRKNLIQIYGPMTIDLTTEYTETEWKNTDFCGYMTQNNVDVEGVGDFGSVVIKADLPVETDASHVSRISTLHVTEGNFTWKNILFIGGNVRYACHDDDARTIGDVRFERCTFLKLQNKGTYPNAFAGGWFNNKSDKYFVDCNFISEWDNMYIDHAAFSYHSRPNSTLKRLIHIENCGATVKGQGSELRLGGMKGTKGINSVVRLIGNKIKRVFVFEEGYSPIGIDLDLFGYANTGDLEICVRKSEGQRAPEINITGDIKEIPYDGAWTN